MSSSLRSHKPAPSPCRAGFGSPPPPAHRRAGPGVKLCSHPEIPNSLTVDPVLCEGGAVGPRSLCVSARAHCPSMPC